MAVKRRTKRKAAVEEDLPNPGERQRARFPDWWETTNQAELAKAHARARQLIDGEPISWD